MGKFDSEIAQLVEENRLDAQILEEYETGHITTLIGHDGIYVDETKENIEHLKREIENRDRTISFYRYLNPQWPKDI